VTVSSVTQGHQSVDGFVSDASHTFFFGGLLLTEISAEDISRYKVARKKEGASSRTIAMEVGSIRALLRKHRLWVYLQPDLQVFFLDKLRRKSFHGELFS
jgi:hypothetical protein